MTAIAFPPISAMEREFRARTETINDVLIARGRCVALTYIPVSAIKQLERICADVAFAADDTARDALYAEANVVIGKYCFNPHYRAFMQHRAQRMPYMQDVAHILESANFLYYEEDYFGAVHLLLPAVENLLNRHVGYALADGHRPWKATLAMVEAMPTAEPDPRFAERVPIYRKYVAAFVRDFFRSAKDDPANFDELRLSRMYGMHGLGNAGFYHYANCQTLFQFFDLYLEMLSCETGAEKHYSCVDDEDPVIDKRANRYWSAIVERYLAGGPSDAEALRRLNPGYVHQTADTNYIALHGADDKEFVARALPTVVSTAMRVLGTLTPDAQRAALERCGALFTLLGIEVPPPAP